MVEWITSDGLTPYPDALSVMEARAVTAARRAGDRAILTIVDGTGIPVSRSNVPRLRVEGLLR